MEFFLLGRWIFAKSVNIAVFSIFCFARKLAAGILKRNEILHTIPFNMLITCHDVVSMIWIPYTAFV